MLIMANLNLKNKKFALQNFQAPILYLRGKFKHSEKKNSLSEHIIIFVLVFIMYNNLSLNLFKVVFGSGEIIAKNIR